MKKYIFITTLLAISSLLLSGCMTTWPIVDDLNHYQKWDTYENRKINNEKENLEENTQEIWEPRRQDWKTIEINNTEDNDK